MASRREPLDGPTVPAVCCLELRKTGQVTTWCMADGLRGQMFFYVVSLCVGSFVLYFVLRSVYRNLY